MQQRHHHIEKISNLTQAIANLSAQDVLIFDLDETLMQTGLDKYQDQLQLTEPGLQAALASLRERGIRLLGLTARKEKYAQQTQQQLQQLGIVLDEIIHAPSIVNKHSKSKRPQKGSVLKSYIETHALQHRRIFMFDDKQDQLKDILKSFKGSDVDLHLKHYEIPHYQPINLQSTTGNNFPERLDNFKKKKALGGGTNSVFAIRNSATAQQLVLKSGAHEDAAKIEMLCNVAYRILGVKVPAMRVYHTLPTKLTKELGLKKPHGMYQLSELIKADDKQPAAIIPAAARKDFAAHALLGNIDVAKSSNFVVDKHGDAYLIDAGANFLFRSRGAVRKEDAALASEIDSLRNSKINPNAHAWFASLSDAEIAEQVTTLLARQPELEAAIWAASRHLHIRDELRQQFLTHLSDRLDCLATRFCHLSQRYAKTDKRAYADRTAAGIFTYTMIDGTPHVLLSKRVRHEWWDNFGGKSENSDHDLAETAQREVAEESSQQLNFTHPELLASPFHDLVTTRHGKQHLYRMYLTQYSAVDLQKLNDHEHTAHQWVPLSALLTALDNNKLITMEGKKTIAVQHANHEFAIFPPLCHMLQQPEVRANLHRLQTTGRMLPTHTLSHDIAHAAGEAVSRHRPLATPATVRREIAETLKYKSSMLREFKKIHGNSVQQQASLAPVVAPTLAPSELHLRAMLGAHYHPHDLAANVRKFMQAHYPDAAGDETLIGKLVAVIETEKANPQHFHFYHACNNQIAFAYDVYTALYQALHADAQWAAFRPDSEHFRKFTNIGEFIAFYSQNGKLDINNNAEHYHDCALSANVFLFGNHQAPSSASVYYLLHNKVTRSVDLHELFSNLLRPFQVSAEEITRLLAIYQLYAAQQGGTLYQIAVPQAEASRLSYAAGSCGVLNAWQTCHDLPEIMQSLQAKQGGEGSQLHSYLSSLQARVMVPPHLRLAVQAVTCHQRSAAEQQSYQQALQQSAADIMATMLRHHGVFQQNNQQAPMVRMLPSILEDNQLSLSGTVNDSMLAHIILSNDVATTKKILTMYPELKGRKIAVPQEYISGAGHGSHPDDVMQTPQEMIFNHSTMPLEVIIECYGAVHLQDYLQRKVITSRKLVEVLERMTAANRLALLNMTQHVKLDDDSLSKILSMLPEHERLTVVDRHLQHDVTCRDLYIVLGWLPDAAVPDLVRKHQASIKDGHDLYFILCQVPEADKLTIAVEHQHKIDNLYHLSKVVITLPAANRLAYVMNVEINNTEFRGLYDLLGSLTHSEALLVANKYLHLLKNGSLLAQVLERLPATEKTDFAMQHRAVIDNAGELVMVLERLPKEDRLKLAITSLHKISDEEALKNLAYMYLPYQQAVILIDKWWQLQASQQPSQHGFFGPAQTSAATTLPLTNHAGSLPKVKQ